MQKNSLVYICEEKFFFFKKKINHTIKNKTSPPPCIQKSKGCTEPRRYSSARSAPTTSTSMHWMAPTTLWRAS